MIESRGLVIDPSSYRVTHDNKPVTLSTLEFRLLYYLATRPNPRLHTRPVAGLRVGHWSRFPTREAWMCTFAAGCVEKVETGMPIVPPF